MYSPTLIVTVLLPFYSWPHARDLDPRTCDSYRGTKNGAGLRTRLRLYLVVFLVLFKRGLRILERQGGVPELQVAL